MPDRLNRAVDGRTNALEQLRKAREGGGKRSDTYRVEEAGAVYDVVDEEQYETALADRRRLARSFVEKDMEGGEVDVGCSDEEEEDDDVVLGDADDEGAREWRKERRRSSVVAKSRARKTTASSQRREHTARPEKRQARLLLFGGRGAATTTAAPRLPSGAGERPAGRAFHGGGGGTKSLVDELVTDDRALDDEMEEEDEESEWATAATPGTSARDAQWPPAAATFTPALGDSAGRCAAILTGLDTRETMTPGVSDDTPQASYRSTETPMSTAGGEAGTAAGLLPPEDSLDGPLGALVEAVLEACTAPPSKPVTTTASPMVWPVAPPAAAYEAEGCTAAAPAAADDDDVFDLYVLDIQEVRDQVYVIGKRQLHTPAQYVPACVQVTGMQREVFFLPRAYALPERAGAPADVPVQVMPRVGAVGSACVYDEVKQLLAARGVDEFRAKEERRLYVMEGHGVPRDANTAYLRVTFPARHPPLPAHLEGRTFSQVFGCGAALSERLVLENRIMGPCWVRVSGATAVTGLSFCGHCYRVPAPSHLQPLVDVAAAASEPPPPPPLRCLALSVRTVLDASTQQHQIAVVAGVLCDDLPSNRPAPDAALTPGSRLCHSFVLVRPLAQQSLPFGFERQAVQRGIECERNETALLDKLLHKLCRYDPDLVMVHGLLGHTFEVLMHRLRELQVRKWSRLGRLVQMRSVEDMRRALNATGGGGGGSWTGAWCAAAFAGRLVCDTEVAAREYAPREKDYRLAALRASVLAGNAEGAATDASDEPAALAFTDAPRLLRLASAGVSDAHDTLRLANRLSVVPLSNELASISGYLWGRTLLGGRAERIEYLLLHELHRAGTFIAPDKLSKRERAARDARVAAAAVQRGAAAQQDGAAALPRDTPSGTLSSYRRKPAYQGGFVLEPVRGLYTHCILQLDFSSLYPSIIQEYNIDFTTVERDGDGAARPPAAHRPPGVLPQVLRRLVERRRQVRAAMKGETDAVALAQRNHRQLALKLTANAMYGCLGYSGSRFYAPALAELVTRLGRETLERTVDIARGQGVQVVYGDTDSIFVNTGVPFQRPRLSALLHVGHQLRRLVNRQYKTLEIEMEAVYVRMLLLHKKKYAGLKYDPVNDTTVKEVKGIEVVRHDWCALVTRTGHYVLDQVLDPALSHEQAVTNIHAYLQQVSRGMRDGAVPLRDYVITKQLSQRPEEYPDAHIQPHVQVALRRRAAGHAVPPGTYIQYVIVEATTTTTGTFGDALATRAYHPDEVREAAAAGQTLRVDVSWYLANQIHPCLTRIVESVPGTDAARLAEALGLDPRRYAPAVKETRAERTPGRGDAAQPALRLEDLYGAHSNPQVKPWRVTCPACQNERTLEGIDLAATADGRPTVNGCAVQCPAPGCDHVFSAPALANSLVRAVRCAIRDHYTAPYRTADGQRTVRGLWLKGNGEWAHPTLYEAHDADAGAAGMPSKRLERVHRAYDEVTLYAQLQRYQRAVQHLSCGVMAPGDAACLQAAWMPYWNACAFRYIRPADRIP